MSRQFFRRFTKKFFIITNIILVLLFLTGCYGYWFNPQYFWPIGFLTLSVFYFFLLLLVFAIFWLFVKPRWSLISLIAILLAYKSVTNVIPLRLSSPFDKIKHTNSLRLMSWNVAQFDILQNKKHPEVKEQMMGMINEYQPDVACFQEMVCEDSVVAKTHSYINEYLQPLGFPDYFYSYNRKEDFWDYAHFGIIIFSKYPIINKQTIMSYPYDYNSIFQYVDIVKGADTFRLFNIHLQSLRFSRDNLKYIDEPGADKDAIKESKSIISKFKTGFVKRKAQANRIKEEMDKSPYPVMVCGDLNDVPNSYAYHTIGVGLKNAFVEKGSGLGRTFSGIAPTLRIDNIFVDPRFSVVQFVRIKKKLSDHFPIIADIQLDKK